MLGIEIIFWFSLALVFYIYLGYPLLIGLCAYFFPRPVKKAPFNAPCSVLISCYNESSRLPEKIQNLLAMQGSDQIVEILIGSDGSTDSAWTSISDPRVKLIPFSIRRGKPAVMNDLIFRAEGSILLMADVRQPFSSDALVNLLRNFADVSVGAVSGELVFVRDIKDSSAVAGISAYWRYEKWIRKAESSFASVPGATGAIYAIRKELIRPMPASLVLDDVVFPMFAVMNGKRCVFESGAVAYDTPVQDIGRESVRKRRTIAGCIQLIRHFPRWCIPGFNPIAWQYVSHKLLRLFSPCLLIVALITSIMLSSSILYRLLCLAQCAGYAIGVLGWLTSRSQIKIPLLGTAAFFMGMQLTIMGAWLDLVRNRVRPAWDVSGTKTEQDRS